ncbi:hypothetical protein J4Q44_G00055100, partial [Coregonus suidteri]
MVNIFIGSVLGLFKCMNLHLLICGIIIFFFKWLQRSWFLFWACMYLLQPWFRLRFCIPVAFPCFLKLYLNKAPRYCAPMV